MASPRAPSSIAPQVTQWGMVVVALASSPLHTEILEPDRVGDAIAGCRGGFDFIVVDMHPSYSPLNRAIFARADRSSSP